jgi:Hint domain
MAILTVGPGQQFTTIEAAVAAASSGDTVDVQAGIYTNDFVSIFQNLTLQAVGGPVQMVETAQPPNGKAMIDEGGAGVSVTINGFDISGVTVPDANGAAIRYEGGALTLNNDYFHDNQNGVLGAPDPNGTININNSEFAFNGVGGDGHTHNIYVGEIATLTVTDSYFHDANVGHEIKSRAADTIITNSRIFDLQSSASYSIDLPNGGNATITNNVIEQGPNTQNPNIIAYGEEAPPLNPGTSVLIADNTIINDDTSASANLLLNAAATPLPFQNNGVWGLLAAQLASVAALGTTFLTTEPTLNTASTWDVGLCFLATTLIATPAGEVRVEELAVGDAVLTLQGEARRIVWIGEGFVLNTRGRRTAATPVIVRKGALADHVPHHDLRVTKGHSLYIDGLLIPVESLVNHRSILFDDQAREVRFYHIELETHDVLLANGAPMETYRDDGNRWLFRNANRGWALPPHAPCAPLLTTGSIVDGVWRRLLERAGPRPGVPLTDDPDLHLLVDGKRVDALAWREAEYVFRLPIKPRNVRMCSRAAVPQELGVARDPRMLGVAVRRIVLAQAGRQRAFEASNDSLIDGYHAYEPDNDIRWTDGNAELPTSLFAGMGGAGMLMLHLGSATTRYPDDGRASRAA